MKALSGPVLNAACLCGGSSSIYLLEPVESKAFRFIDAPHLSVTLSIVAPCFCFSFSLTLLHVIFGRCLNNPFNCVPNPKILMFAIISHENCVGVGIYGSFFFI